MNELIEQLMIKASCGSCYDGQTEAQLYGDKITSFAQLIMAECCVALHPMLRDMISRTQGVDMIVKHFRGKE